MEIVVAILVSSWLVFNEAAAYMLFGFVIAGLLRIFIRPESVINYFRHGRFASVVYSALLGVPIPLCSCGVVPAVAGLRKQGANNGACLAFLISAPETGADSIALTYSLLDPIITIMRPVAALITAVVAGVTENFLGRSYIETKLVEPDRTCPVDGCCDGIDCDPLDHARHHSLLEKISAGIRYAANDLMDDLAGFFVLGILLAGVISTIMPESVFSGSWGSGLWAYLGMLVVSLPLYVCATLSTPIAAALVIKGMSPGAALVLLLAGPATNMATITMVSGLLGTRTLAIYLGSIVVCTLCMAFLTDGIYHWLGVSAAAAAGSATGETLPLWLQWASSAVLGLLVVRSLWRTRIAAIIQRFRTGEAQVPCSSHSCGCTKHSHHSDH